MSLHHQVSQGPDTRDSWKARCCGAWSQNPGLGGGVRGGGGTAICVKAACRGHTNRRPGLHLMMESEPPSQGQCAAEPLAGQRAHSDFTIRITGFPSIDRPAHATSTRKGHFFFSSFAHKHLWASNVIDRALFIESNIFLILESIYQGSLLTSHFLDTTRYGTMP